MVSKRSFTYERPFLASGLVAALTGAGAAAEKIGFIYVGPAADYGYNMSMDLGRQYVEKELGVETTARANRGFRGCADS